MRGRPICLPKHSPAMQKIAAKRAAHHTRAYIPAVDRSLDDAKPLYRVAKDLGSDLCLLPNAICNLRRILES
jgi:hypothetical protein